MLAFVMLFSVLATSLIGCNGDDNTDTDTSTDSSQGNSNNPDGTADYTVVIKTAGGIPVPDVTLSVLLDGNIKDYGATDRNGSITFKLPKNNNYVVSVKNPPAGYKFDNSYKLNEAGTVITTPTSLIENEENKTPTGTATYGLGSVMLDYAFKTVDGTTVKLSEILKTKKAILINFFFTTCGPCQNELPYMVSSYEKHKDDIEVIAINPYPTETEADVVTFANAMGLTFPVAKVDYAWAKAFGVENYPTNIIIDRFGVITLVEVGGIMSETPFNIMFDYFGADNYVQKLVTDIEQITPTEKPNVEMPSNEEIGSAINSGDIKIEYFPEDDEMAWPFVVKEDEDGNKYIYNSNSGKINSFAQINMNVELKAGDVLTFDYLANTENTQSTADIVYVFADGKDIFQIVGAGGGWKTCYAYVADKDGEYEINILYMKNEIMENDPENDGIAIKNMRIAKESDIDEPTYISKYAATQPNANGLGYNKYADLVLDDDGFYRVCQKHTSEEGHVCDKNGPYLLAELIGVTQFAPDTSVTIMAYGTELPSEVAEKVLQYCNYASNSKYYGLTAVNEELKGLLIEITKALGIDGSPNEWLQMCEYYAQYGENVEPLDNPIKGLTIKAPFIATEGADKPNYVEYDGRQIMPRGLLYKFVPTKSGAYRITTNSEQEVLGWVFLDEKQTQYTHSDMGERLSYNYIGDDHMNCTMVAYFEEGKEYYIDIAYYDVYCAGSFTYTIEYLGESYDKYFVLASPGPFTFEEGENFNPDTLEGIGATIAGGVDVMLGEDGYYYVKNADGSKGSLLYADFYFTTNIFPEMSLKTVVEQGGFNFAQTEADREMIAKISSYEVQYILEKLKEELGEDVYNELYKDNLLVNIINGKETTDNTALTTSIEKYRTAFKSNDDNIRNAFKKEWGDNYATEAAVNKIEDVIKGIYHGEGEDYTEEMSVYIDKMIDVEYDGETPINPELQGCVIVDERLGEILQALMDKFTFKGVEHSWTKLCYYYLYVGPQA